MTPPGEQRAVGPVILGLDRLTGPEIMALNNIRSWLERQLANPQIVTLTLIVVTLAAVVYFFGNMLAPVFAAVVIAYLLEGIVVRLERRRVPHLAAVLVVFLSFFTFLIFAVFGLLPLLIRQLTQLAQQVPAMAARMQAALLELPQRYSVVSEAQIQDLLAEINLTLRDPSDVEQVIQQPGHVVSLSLNRLPSPGNGLAIGLGSKAHHHRQAVHGLQAVGFGTGIVVFFVKGHADFVSQPAVERGIIRFT